MNSIELGGSIADELEGIAALDQGEPLRDQALKLHRLHLRAVLLALACPLRPLVVIEIALDPLDAAVEHVHERPQERVQVGLQTRVRERRNQRIEHVGEGALQPGGLGQQTRIGLVVEGAMGMEGEFFQEMGGRGHGLGNLGIVGVAVKRHRVCSSFSEAAPMRGLLAIEKPGAAEARTPKAEPAGAGAQPLRASAASGTIASLKAGRGRRRGRTRRQRAQTRPWARLHQLTYQAGSWSRAEKVIARVEATEMGSDARFVVTNLTGRGKVLYEKVYCARGRMENMILDPACPRGARDGAILALGWAGALRSEEITRLAWDAPGLDGKGHIVTRPVGIDVHSRRTKTDQTGSEAQQVIIPAPVCRW